MKKNYRQKRRLFCFLPTLFCLIGLSVLANCSRGPSSGEDMESVFRLFPNAPSKYRPAPFWVWNELMTIEKVQRQLQDLKDKGFGGAFVHARPGLITPYLSEKWLFLFKEAVKLGRELGLKIWVYDENSYPSGFAGGLVPAAFPEVARSGLRGKKLNKPDLNQVADQVCILQEEDGRFVDITERVKAGEKGWPEGKYWVFEVVIQEPSPWYAGFTYVDLMRPGVTQSFLRLTLDAYKRVVGEEFGSTVPGSFQDEAEIAPAGGRWSVNYTPALFSEFKARRGYELKTELPSGRAWPGSFQQAPPGGQPAGKEYNFLDYGLDDVIIIEKIKNKN